MSLRTCAVYKSIELVVRAPVVPRRLAGTVKCGSGHSKCRVCGFLLLCVPTGGVMVYVRYDGVKNIRLRCIFNFDEMKINFEICWLFPLFV